MTEGAHFAFYLARSDCPTLEFPVLADRNELPLFIKESLTRKEASDSFDNSFKRRIILNPFTDEELRSKLLSSTECLEEPFMHSLAAEAFKTISVKRAVKKVQEHTSDFLDWSNIEAQAANALIVEFTKDEILTKQIDSWTTGESKEKDALAVIVPHAGYGYSGPTAGKSYSAFRSTKERTELVVVFGPSHFTSLKNVCGLSQASELESPLGPLSVDIELNQSLSLHTKHFKLLSKEWDEQEHSLEMQFPFIKRAFPKAKVVPIMVGHLDEATRKVIAKHLLNSLPDLTSGKVKFVISSDFCHFGERFRFYGNGIQHSDQIKELDLAGFEALSSVSSFQKYLQQTGNTICGREPILLFLQMLEVAKLHHSGWKLLGYSQSNAISVPTDSSVSYLAASLSLNDE